MPQKRTRMLLVCAQCGADFERWKWHHSQVPKYCSRACLKAAAPRRPLVDRLWEKVVKTDTCWLKQGATAGLGYGVIGSGGHDGANVYTHVAAWWLATGRWPVTGEVICHTCDVARCCRNDDMGTYEVAGVLYERHGHLWLGTDKANALDKMAKGRENRALHLERVPRGERHILRTRPEVLVRGEAHHDARLSDDIVRQVRIRYAAGGTTYLALAVEYGVTERAMAWAIQGKTWRHVE